MPGKGVVFVSGGNTKNLLALWREWDLDSILKKAWENGVVMSGASAGGICWFQQGSTDSWPNEFNALDAMGWLEGSFCPHYSSESGRRETYMEMVKQGQLSAGYGVTDRAAFHYVDAKLDKAVSEWEEAAVFRVECKDGDVTETEMPLTRLVPE